RDTAGGEATGRAWHLDVLILGVEHRCGELQPMIEDRCFPARLITVDRLRLEGHEIVDVLRRWRSGGIGAWGGGCQAARIEAASFEASRIAQVDVVIFVWLEVDRN